MGRKREGMRRGREGRKTEKMEGDKEAGEVIKGKGRTVA